MKFKRKLKNMFFEWTPEQKKQFYKYIPGKVYYTERNISTVVACIQLFMIIVFLFNRKLSTHNLRYIGYFSLYIFLLVATCIAIVAYHYTVKKKAYKHFFWIRRTYALTLCIWVMGITYLELLGGKGLSSFYYLMPTTAAMLLLNPIESFVIFGGSWVCLFVIILNLETASGNTFGNLTNSIFVTILSLFISYRYYKSSATEFCDRQLIQKQYKEIESKNNLLVDLVQTDQLTCLYNRHYLTEKLYSIFNEHRNEHFYGLFLMLDIDFFKQYNDLYGHLQGDQCLKTIASTLNNECDNFDASAIRYGGEEFLIIKMSPEKFDVDEFVNQIFNSVKETQLYRPDIEPYYVTISMGIWAGSLANVETIENAIKHADEALYEAKSNGRNCFVFSSKSKDIINKNI